MDTSFGDTRSHTKRMTPVPIVPVCEGCKGERLVDTAPEDRPESLVPCPMCQSDYYDGSSEDEEMERIHEHSAELFQEAERTYLEKLER